MSAAEEPFGRIVVALRDVSWRDRAVRGLRRAGYRAEGASDGVRALWALEASPWGMVLDLDLPRIDGFAVLAEVRARSGPSPVVFPASTRLGDSAPIRQAVRDLGGAPLLHLPCNDVELASLVRVLLGPPHQQPGGPRWLFAASMPELRHAVRLPARVRQGERERDAQVVSGGPGGLCLVTREAPARGAGCSVRFLVPDTDRVVEIQGQVTRVSTRPGGPAVVTVAHAASPCGPGAPAWLDLLARWADDAGERSHDIPERSLDASAGPAGPRLARAGVVG